MTTFTTNSVAANTVNNTQKEMATMTKTATAFAVIDSKQVMTSAGVARTFPVQVKMELVIGTKVQKVTFGYSRLGGRQMYLVVDGKAPVNMNKAAFIERLTKSGITNVKEVSSKLSVLKSFYRDEFTVAKCSTCKTGSVTAANVDYVQRNHEKLTKKLGYAVSSFSCICYGCQRSGSSVSTPAPKASTKSTTPIKAKAEAAACVSCAKEIKSPKVARFSIQKYGVALCYGECQTKYAAAKVEESTKPSMVGELTTYETVEDLAADHDRMIAGVDVQADNTIWVSANNENLFTLTPAMIEAIMELEVENFSVLADLKMELEYIHAEQRNAKKTEWKQLHLEGLANRASAASTITSVETETAPDSGADVSIQTMVRKRMSSKNLAERKAFDKAQTALLKAELKAFYEEEALVAPVVPGLSEEAIAQGNALIEAYAAEDAVMFADEAKCPGCSESALLASDDHCEDCWADLQAGILMEADIALEQDLASIEYDELPDSLSTKTEPTIIELTAVKAPSMHVELPVDNEAGF